MGCKGARRRMKEKRKELAKDIDDFLDNRNQHSATQLANATDTDLFSVDKTGTNAHIPSEITFHSIGRSPSRQRTASKRRGIVKKIKPRNKAELSVQKAERFFDIWAENVTSSKPERDPEAPTIWKGDRVPRPGKGPRPNIPAVSVDAPGCSFNPDPVHHQKVLREKEIAEEQTMKKLSEMSEIDVLHQEQLFDELENIHISEDESNDDEEEKSGIIHRPKIPERKTRAQRNKEKRHSQYLKEIENRKKIKKLHAQINNAREINRSITKQLRESHIKNLKRKEKKKIRDKRGLHRLGRKMIRDAPLEVQSLDATSAPSLRRLHGSNDLALHRYISLQKRGKIETGRFRGRKNRKKCTYHSVGLQRRRLEETKKEFPVLQKRVQEMHDQLHQIKLSETAT